VNIIVAREDNKDAENVKEFMQSYQSPEVAKAAETPGLLQVGGTDNGDIDLRIVQHPRQLRTLQLHNFQVSRVTPNDPTNLGRALLLLQKEQLITLKAGTGLLPTAVDVGRVIGNGDGRAIFNIRNGFNLSRIAGHGKDKSIADGHQVVAVRFVNRMWRKWRRRWRKKSMASTSS
jgi:hypothetical protein